MEHEFYYFKDEKELPFISAFTSKIISIISLEGFLSLKDIRRISAKNLNFSF